MDPGADGVVVAAVTFSGVAGSLLDPPVLTVLGSTGRLLARARDASGSTVCSLPGLECYSPRLQDERFEWTTDPPGVVSLAETGTTLYANGAVHLTALSEGRVGVTAAVDGVRGTAVVDVVERARLVWSVPTLGQLQGVAIGRDGTIYVAGREGLQAVGPGGTVRWSLPRGAVALPSASVPAIADDGTLYLATNDSLVAIDPSGDVLWATALDDIQSTPAIGPDGTLHLLTGGGSLYAVGPTGLIEWRFEVPGPPGWRPSPPAIGLDGTIYVGSWDHHLYAIGPDGHEAWRFLTPGPVRSPTIGTDGTVFAASDRIREPGTFTVLAEAKLFALDAGGAERWSVPLDGDVWEGPALGPGGTVFMASDDSIYALDPGGAKLWTMPSGSIHAPVLAGDGSIYLGSRNLYVLGAEGRPRWEYLTRYPLFVAPAIGMDGSLYAGVYEDGVHWLRAFTEPGVSNGGYDGAPWPQPRGDRANTGRARARP